jgi:hypothetical protein
MTSTSRLPLPFQILAAAVLFPPESYLAARITHTVCAYQDFWQRIDMTSDDYWVCAFLLGLFIFVIWLKERAVMSVGLAVVTSLLVSLSVCMDMWQLSMPSP